MHEIHDISDLDPDGLPSSRSLFKATLVAAVVAAVLLLTAVLPAEFGIDPTGVGAKLGLTALHAADAQPTPGPAEASTGTGIDTSTGTSPESGPVRQAAGMLRSDTMKLPLGPGQGAEIKAVMQAGQGFVFRWQADGGPVHFDMHGEPPGTGDSFTSFWIEDAQDNAGGSFVAPFDGTHGWYWENRGSQPVTIQLSTSGFYENLYMP